MNLSRYIACRYFFSPTKRTFIHRLSLFSMGMVAVGTMALVIALSAFNGMESLLRAQYATFDPAISLRPRTGYTFSFSDSLSDYLGELPSVSAYSPVLEDYALVSFRGQQEVVRMRGIVPSFLSGAALRHQLRQGEFSLQSGNQPQALIGEGLQYALSMPLRRGEAPQLQIFYPTKRLSFDPRSLYHSRSLPVAGSFAINRAQDRAYVLVPLAFARTLLGDSSRCTSVALRLQPEAKTDKIASQLRQDIGDRYQVLTREQQHATLYRLLRIEKFFVFLVFVFILVVASFGLFFVLVMLFLEKRTDLALLRALGGRSGLLGGIFVWEGMLISCVGGGVGLVLGLVLCYLQQQYGLVSLGIEGSSAAYPIEVRAADVLLALACVMGLTLMAALRPAWLASRHKDLALRQHTAYST